MEAKLTFTDFHMSREVPPHNCLLLLADKDGGVLPKLYEYVERGNCFFPVPIDTTQIVYPHEMQYWAVLPSLLTQSISKPEFAINDRVTLGDSRCGEGTVENISQKISICWDNNRPITYDYNLDDERLRHVS